MREERILLVEDNPDDVDLTLDALQRHGIESTVDVASDGVQALGLLGAAADAQPPVLPALVILDINLPRMSGLEVLARMRADPRLRYLPVVLLTTSVEERDVAEGYRLGANAYVRKPVAFDEFIEAAGRIGRFWLRDNVRAPG
ncbi:MAG: response regulator [Rubrivivax sp.]|nr:response regulator [Rubrivivax sp.]